MKKKRLQYMHAVYELSGGNEHILLNMWEIGEKLGFGGHGSDLTDKIVQYLHGEGLIKFQALGGIFGITHRGIKEVEHALNYPEQPTEHFVPLATVQIIHVAGNMVNSTIQEAGAGSTQTATISAAQITELKEIIEELRKIILLEKLSPDQKEELDKEVEMLALEAFPSILRDVAQA